MDTHAHGHEELLLRAAKPIAVEDTRETHLVSFSTEAGLFQAAGLEAVVCGPGHIEQAHKPNEFVERAQLGACLAMLDGLVAKLSKSS